MVAIQGEATQIALHFKPAVLRDRIARRQAQGPVGPVRDQGRRLPGLDEVLETVDDRAASQPASARALAELVEVTRVQAAVRDFHQPRRRTKAPETGDNATPPALWNDDKRLADAALLQQPLGMMLERTQPAAVDVPSSRKQGHPSPDEGDHGRCREGDVPADVIRPLPPGHSPPPTPRPGSGDHQHRGGSVVEPRTRIEPRMPVEEIEQRCRQDPDRYDDVTNVPVPCENRPQDEGQQSR